MLLLYWFPTLVCALRIAILARFTGNFEVCCSFPGTLIRRCRFWRGGSTLLISKQKQYDKKHRFRFGKQSTAIRLWLLSKESHSTFQEGKNTLSGKRRGDYVFNSSALFISAFRPWLTWLVEHISVESAIRFDLKGRLLYCLSENKKKRHFGEHGATISPCLNSFLVCLVCIRRHCFIHAHPSMLSSPTCLSCVVNRLARRIKIRSSLSR